MALLRCPKFLRCLTAYAGNFDRGHSLTSLYPPLAALSSLPTSARPHCTLPAGHAGPALKKALQGGPHVSRRTSHPFVTPSVGVGVLDDPTRIPTAPHAKTPVIAKPVRTLAVAIRDPLKKPKKENPL